MFSRCITTFYNIQCLLLEKFRNSISLTDSGIDTLGDGTSLVLSAILEMGPLSFDWIQLVSVSWESAFHWSWHLDSAAQLNDLSAYWRGHVLHGMSELSCT